MCEHFIPILKERGQEVRKAGKRLVRPAKKGEEILTVKKGVVMLKTPVTDDTSMVILHESSMDYNLHVVEAAKFAKNYSQHGVELEDKSPRLQELRKRGFRYHERKGLVLMYRLREEDMDFFPSRKYIGCGIPQEAEVGDYLVAPYPELNEIYGSRSLPMIFLTPS